MILLKAAAGAFVIVSVWFAAMRIIDEIITFLGKAYGIKGVAAGTFFFIWILATIAAYGGLRLGN